VRRLPHTQAASLSKGLCQALLSAANETTPIAILAPSRSLNGSLFHQDFSLIQSSGNVSGNLRYFVGLAQQTWAKRGQKSARNRIFRDHSLLAGNLGDFACSDHARLVEFSRTLVGGAELLIMATCVTAAALILMAGLLSRVHVRKLKRRNLDLEKQLVEARATASRRLTERLGAQSASERRP
jgi:hypothetical protein